MKKYRKVTVIGGGPQDTDRQYAIEGVEGICTWVCDLEETQSFLLRDEQGNEHIVRYGVIEDGELIHLCNEVGCGSSKSPCCKNRQEGTVCRYWHKNGTPRPKDEHPGYYAVT